MPGTLFVVATPIGNLEDITARALRILREVAIIAAEDTRRTAHLLAHYGIPTPTTSLHEHNEAARGAALVERLVRGDNIAVVSDAGSPTLSDPGARFVRAAIDAGIRVEPIPGPSAVVAALSVAGVEADSFLFLGFPPTRSRERRPWLESARAAGRPVVFFEAPHRIRRTLEDLLAAIGDLTIVVARELTKKHEELVRGPISKILVDLKEPRGEFTVVLDCGQTTEHDRPCVPGPAELVREFGELTKTTSSSRASAIATLARRHGLSRNMVYRAIEDAKKSVT